MRLLWCEGDTLGIVHFNNGMHGDGYTEEQYKAAFPELLTTIRAICAEGEIDLGVDDSGASV